MSRSISFVTESFPAVAGLDTTLSRALLRSVSAGQDGETFRLYSPGRVLAFGKRDAVTSGFPGAAAAAAAAGYVPLIRLAGGRAAVFHESTIGFGWTIPIDEPRAGIQARFDLLAELMVRSFARVGVAAAIGEIPGEYCPGRFSVHHAGGRKVMGVGQRLAKRAAHVGGVIVLDDADAINDVLRPVYGALGAAFDPAVTGALRELQPQLSVAALVDAIRAELEALGDLSSATLSMETVAAGRAMLADHIVAVPKAA